MTGALQATNATVDKFIGDSVMAFWNAPRPMENHALAACRAALGCQKALRGLWDRWKKEGSVPPMRTRMGIHTGDALVGNIGSRDRLSYTAVGDTVNLASRLEGINKYYGTRVIISESTKNDLDDALTLRLIDRVVVKGKSSGIAVYELISEEPPEGEAAEFLEAWEGAMELYEDRRWPEAAASFGALVLRHPTDGPGKLLAARCAGFASAPPPDNWDGFYVMHEK
jgi:adenylate cyclase